MFWFKYLLYFAVCISLYLRFSFFTIASTAFMSLISSKCSFVCARTPSYVLSRFFFACQYFCHASLRNLTASSFVTSMYPVRPHFLAFLFISFVFTLQPDFFLITSDHKPIVRPWHCTLFGDYDTFPALILQHFSSPFKTILRCSLSICSTSFIMEVVVLPPV